MKNTVEQDLFTSFKRIQFNQLQAILKNYKQAQANPFVGMDTKALAEAIADLEGQLRDFEAELNALNA
jgi:hypothetical protein